MIYTFVPYSSEKKFGKAINAHCRLVPSPDDWICVQDADLMHLVPDFGTIMEEYISLYPDAGLFTSITNRVGSIDQMYPGVFDEPNILEHRKIALKLRDKNRGKVTQLGKFISGYLMLFKKSTWEQCGGFHETGILAIDNHFSSAIYNRQKKIYLMNGLYTFHLYRMDTGASNKDHLL